MSKKQIGSFFIDPTIKEQQKADKARKSMPYNFNSWIHGDQALSKQEFMQQKQSGFQELQYGDPGYREVH